MIKKYFPVLIASTALTILFLRPILTHFSTHLTSRADGVFISWTIYTISEYLYQGKNIFNLPHFYPFQNTLAYSDPFLSTALLTLPLLSFTNNIVAIHNFHLIAGTIVMYVAAYLLAQQLKYSKIGSHFAALIFTFSAIHLHYTVHLQSYLLTGIPLTFYFLLRWIDEKRWLWLALTFGAFLYQAVNSPMSGFFLIFSLIPLFVGGKIFKMIATNWKLVSYYSMLTAIALAIFYIPYFAVSQQFEYVRSIRDTAHFAHSINRLFELDLFVVYALLFVLWRTKTTGIKSKTHYYIIAIGTILMLGPVLKLSSETVKIFNTPIPLPHALLYYVIPGFKAFRDSSRWILVMNFGLAMLTGQLVTLSKLRNWVKIVFFTLLCFMYYGFAIKNIQLYPIPNKIPQIYEVVQNRPENVLAELPVLSWRMMPYAYLENDRLLYQTFHKKTLYNGVSGFTPPTKEKQWDWLWKEFPSKNSIEYLQNEDIELVIVHYWLYEKMFVDNFEYLNTKSPSTSLLKQKINNQLVLISCKQNSCLYRIR